MIKKRQNFFVHLHPVVQHQHQQHQQVTPVPHEMQANMARFSIKSMFGGADFQDTILGAKNDFKPMITISLLVSEKLPVYRFLSSGSFFFF